RGSYGRPGTLKQGDAYEFRIALWSTSYLVPRGHRVRLSVSCSDFPRIWPDRVKPTIRLFYGGTRASSVTLPAVPAPDKPIAGPEIKRPDLPPMDAAVIPIWKIERDQVAGVVTVSTGSKQSFPLPQGGAMEMDHLGTAKV